MTECSIAGPKLSFEITDELCREVTTLEVKNAIFNINDNKAPGPDGCFSCFFKKAWNVVGDHVRSAVLDFFRSGRMLRQLNHTVIALVPKSEHSSSVDDYRPISCYNVIYKAITKILLNRLAPELEHLIDRCQSAFIGGRNITDNIFLAQEMPKTSILRIQCIQQVTGFRLKHSLKGIRKVCSLMSAIDGGKGFWG
ncbi:UNVERIFIED_CONTAM: hypothetical protein Sindi_0799400 [Sesamum indicum]